MNTQYFVYALEVEKAASITQAADNLFMAQSTLSKSIKDLEQSLGFPVFRRTSKGVFPTQRGREFLSHAQKIVSQIEKMQRALQEQNPVNQIFSLMIPRASYISQAASDFLCTFDNHRDMELSIREANSITAIDAVSEGEYVLGIIRYRVEEEEYFLRSLSEKGLQSENLWQSRFVALMPQNHPLAERSVLHLEDFKPYIEIAFGDDTVPYIGIGRGQAMLNSKRILVYDRAMRFDLLRRNPLTYMWCSPLPKTLLAQNGLVQRQCEGSGEFKDILISRSGYRYSKLDQAFLNTLSLYKNAVAFG